jgi:flagellar biosynthesis chaperone FliJ|tara:strand:+ start:4290 stop:4736 length:447 start_codon:yes stop_codon:yes gene_type:complete
MMAISKIDRFTSLGKMQHQQYQQALESEQQVRQMIDSIDTSVAQVRQYQKDYQKDLVTLQQGASTTETLVRTRKFLQQLMQMEVDQLRQRQGLDQRLQQAQYETMLKLQKSRMSQKLTEKAHVEQLAANKAVDAKQMDAVATQMYTRR